MTPAVAALKLCKMHMLFVVYKACTTTCSLHLSVIMYVAKKRPRENSGGPAAEGTVKRPPKKKQKKVCRSTCVYVHPFLQNSATFVLLTKLFLLLFRQNHSDSGTQ